MDMKKMKINGKPMNVISVAEYKANPDLYNTSCTAIEFSDLGVVLPLVGKTDKRVGVNVGGLFSKLNMPDEEHADEYSIDKVIDFSDCNCMRELMIKQQQVANIEYDMLTTIDNVFKPRIDEHCTPAMTALKTAVIDKNIDIHKYADRYGSNFNNDVRQFGKNDISLKMLTRHCEMLDLKATLVLEDTSDDVANPMGHKIEVELTRRGSDSDD